jgi:hypothetical protein
MIPVFEASLKAKHVWQDTVDHLTSLHFPGSTKISKDFGELREELETRGYVVFHSLIIKDSETFLSINISKY